MYAVVCVMLLSMDGIILTDVLAVLHIVFADAAAVCGSWVDPFYVWSLRGAVLRALKLSFEHSFLRFEHSCCQ